MTNQRLDALLGAIAIIAIIALVAIGVTIKIGVWNECRGQGNSFFYCWRLVS